MEPSDSEWNGWEIGESGDTGSLLDPFQKQEDSGSVISGEGGKDETMYDSSNVEGEDSNFQFDGDMESLEELSESMSDDDEDDSQMNPASVDQSPYRFMNGNDGMATCERCGSIGIKHAFYSKSKRFCSLACSRASASDTDYTGPPQANIPKKQMPVKKQKSGKFIRKRSKQSASKQGGVRTFDWGLYVSGSHAEGAPVSCFRHVPMSDGWDNINIGMKVEVQNNDCDLPNTVYWIATVMKIAGYKALLRYEGFGSDGHKDFWINLCHKDVHPVGWCATSGQPLVPPKTIQHKYADWKDYLVKRLTGSRTLPSNFFNKVQEGINSHKFRKAMQVEVVDRMCVSAMRVATVEEIVGGRLRLKYADSKEEGDEFWCHMRSALVHPVGWSQQVGHKLHSTPEYRTQCLGKTTMQKYDALDATPEMFFKKKEPPEGYKFQVGMKLEAIDPLNLSAICVATVMKVLKHNYLMIGIDGSMAQNGSDWFCYHATSPCIFPVGFCEVNGLVLTPPRGYKSQFKWFDYLKQTRSVAAPVKLFDKEMPKHGFKPGMKLEAVDLMEPRLICVATIAKVVGRLLRIHFDGWESDYDQWVDCESPDLYPIGWCDIMVYPVEGPRLKTEVPVPVSAASPPKKRKGKTQIYKGPRKNHGNLEQHVGRVYPPERGADPQREKKKHVTRKTRNPKSSSSGLPKKDERKPKTPLTPPPTIKSMSSQLDMMRHRLLNTRPEEMVDRPQEVPQVSVLNGDHKPVEIKTEPIDRDFPAAQATPTTITRDIKPLPSSLPPLPANVTNTTRSALLERITSSANSSPKPVHSNLLAGHLTGALPLNVSNSGLVHTPPAAMLAPPKLLLAGAQQAVPETQTLFLTQRQQSLAPEDWSVIDVCHFLKYNDCSAYVEVFHKQNINGQQFIGLTKEQIVSLTGMKVGSSLKIFELIQVLRSKLASQKMQKLTS